MFLLEHPHHTWTFTPGGRGKRKDEVKTGCYVIEHVPTGKLYVDTAKNVTFAVDAAITHLQMGNFPVFGFGKPYSMDPDIKLYEIPTSGIQKARQIALEIKRSVNPAYLLTN